MKRLIPTFVRGPFLILGILLLALVPCRASTAGRVLNLAGDLGFGTLDGAGFTTIQAGLDIREGSLSLALLGRVRLLMEESDEEGPVRRRDYDEPSDYVHILRLLRYRRAFTAVSVEAQAGEIPGFTLGHGTLVRDYSNLADPDHPHSGLRFSVSHSRFDVQGMLDNFIRPSVVALRAGVRPAARIPNLVVGASLVLDPGAPLQVQRGPGGERLVDSATNLETDDEVLALAGLEVGYTLDGGKRGRLEPYLDLNTSMLGVGLHLGALSHVPLGDSGLRLGLQAEYRASSGGYAPGHIETFYDVERFQAGLTFSDPAAAGLDHRSTKLAGLVREVYGGHGALVQVALAYRALARIKLGYTYRPGPDESSLWLRASGQPLSRLNLGLLMMLRGLGGPYEEAQGIAAMAEARVRITAELYALAQYLRTWSLQEETRYFGVLQAFNIGIGATWSR